MRNWILATAAILAVTFAVSGCVNVKVPEGPYYVHNSDAGGDVRSHTYHQMKEFLKDAREDGLITASQHKELGKRLEKKYGAKNR